MTRFNYEKVSFYKMQLLRDKITKIYILWTRWGTIEDQGQYQRTPFGTLEEATKEFEKIFFQKTGNRWGAVENFEEKPKKYKLKELDGKNFVRLKDKIELRSDIVDMQILLKPFKLEKCPKSKLSEDLQALFKLAVDEKMTQVQVKKIFSAMPTTTLTTITSTAIEDASNTLDSIELLIDKMKELKKNKDKAKQLEILSGIQELSDKYFGLLSPTMYRYTAIAPIKSHRILQEQRKLLVDIFDIEVALKFIGGAKLRINEIHPYDYFAKALQVSMKQLKEKDKEYCFVKECIERTRGKEMNNLFINSIIKVAAKTSLPTEEEELFKKTHNHTFLWHGTSACNLLGILSQGLRINPFSANLTGNLFGAGIYFSDTLSKAYMYTTMNTKLPVILLCEVALGNVYNKISSWNSNLHFPPKDYHSFKIAAERGPSVFGKTKDDILFSVGTIEEYEKPFLKEKGVKYTKASDYKKGKAKKFDIGFALGGAPNKRFKEESEEEDDMSYIDSDDEVIRKVTKSEFLKPDFKSHKLPKVELSSLDKNNCRPVEDVEYLVFNPAQARVRYVILLEEFELDESNEELNDLDNDDNDDDDDDDDDDN